MKSSIPIVLVLSVLLRSSCGSAAVVTTTADSGPGSLREAIANAAAGETINFAVSGIIVLTSGELAIDKNLTIAGPGADNLMIQRSLLPGTPDFRIFDIQLGTVTISGLTVNNGRSDFGGGVFNGDDATLNMHDTRISGNSASGAGGGIYNGGTLTLDDTAIIDNSAQGAGIEGAFGGGIENFVGTIVRMNRCVLRGNSVSGNSADGGGFGGALDNAGRILLMDHCDFSGNSATGGPGTGGGFGGAINNISTILALDHCDFGGNSATGGTGDGDGFGGAINNSGTITNSQSIISSNSVTGGATGGSGSGGGINNDGELTLTNSVINGNSATGGPDTGDGFGGGINNGFGTVHVDTGTVSGNVARGGTGSGGGLGEGGGIANGFGTVSLNRSTVSGNFAVGGDGGSGGSGEGAGIANVAGSVNLDNSTVSGNVSSGGAGIGGSGSPYGGGIFNDFGSIELTSSTIASNVVSGGFPQDGGGIFNSEGAVELENTIVAANNATVDFFNGEFGHIISDGFNVVGSTSGPFTPELGDQTGVTAAALKLGTLQDNGGPTFTHALLCGSPAINAGDNTNAPATDQRGFARIVGGIIDIGAYEAGNTAPSISCPNPITLNCAPPTGQAATVSVNVADPDGDPLVVVWTVDGTAYQTNVVAAGGPPTLAQVDLTAVFGVGSHQVTASVSDPSECSATCGVVVTVHPNPPPPTISADGPLSFCQGGSVTLTSSSVTSNLWSTGETTRSITVTNSGSYTVTVTDTNGCSATSAAVDVTVSGETCGNPSLGAAGDCAVLELSTAKVSITGPAGGILGDICIAPGGSLAMSGDQFVTGTVKLGAGARFANSSHGTVNVTQNVDLSSEISDAFAAAANAAGLPCTQSFARLDGSGVTTITGGVGTNVICVRDVVLAGKKITLTGPAGAQFIFNVTGKFVLTGGGTGPQIRVAGGVQPKDVLYNLIGTGPDVAFSGGGGGENCCAAIVDGTLLAPFRKIKLSPGLVNGAVISAQDINIVSGSSVRCPRCNGQ